jgi:uncharacterized protein (TIGR00255 family)
MTGFGSSVCIYKDTVVLIDIRSINSKLFDFSLKIPSIFKDKEQDIRTIVSEILERGKIDMNITIDQSEEILEYAINKDKAKVYYKEFKNLLSDLDLHINNSELLHAIMMIPDVITTQKGVVSHEVWNELKQAIVHACELLHANRINEGKVIEKDFRLRINLIQNYFQQIEPYESKRIDVIRNRLSKHLGDLMQSYDENRLEQELLFYLEKLDITEEKIRLEKHCEYFIDTMNENMSNGKKLSFISQEIGREINTLGSKAYDVDIQKLVVQMKDELEKIKEQLSNVL